MNEKKKKWSRQLVEQSKPRSHVFASSLTANNTKHANLTWLPLEIMHRGHTWHEYLWPWVSLTRLLYNLHLDDVPSADFENSLYAFRQSEKRSMWVSSMYKYNKRKKLLFMLVLSSNCFCYNVLCVAVVVVLSVYILIFLLFGLSRRHKWADDCKHFN